MAKVFEKESVEKGDQSGPRRSHRVFLHLEEREVACRADRGLTREECTEKCVCAGGAERQWSFRVSPPERGQGEKRLNADLALCPLSISHQAAFSKDKLAFITPHKHMRFFKVNSYGLHCDILTWEMKFRNCNKRDLRHDKILVSLSQ